MWFLNDRVFQVYGLNLILGFEGCIVRGQWWSMESKTWNYIQGYGHVERCSQGFESWWHIYLSNFWPGFKNELLVVSILIGMAVIDSNLLEIDVSRISGALYLMHQISAGLLSGLLLVKPFIILSMFWRRLVHITSLLTLLMMIKSNVYSLLFWGIATRTWT